MPNQPSLLTKTTIAAPPWRRVAAYFVDYFVFILPLIGLVSLGAWSLHLLDISLFSRSSWLNHGIAILILTVPVVIYFALSEASRFQATVGKKLMKLTVVDAAGQRLTLAKATVRAVVKFLPWEFFHSIIWHWEGWPANPTPPTIFQVVAITAGWIVVGWFFVSIFFGARRAPYDLAAGTIVVVRKTLSVAQDSTADPQHLEVTMRPHN